MGRDGGGRTSTDLHLRNSIRMAIQSSSPTASPVNDGLGNLEWGCLFRSQLRVEEGFADETLEVAQLRAGFFDDSLQV